MSVHLRPASRAAILLLCVAALCAGCNPPSSERQTGAAPIRTSLGSDPRSLSLIGNTDGGSEMVAALVTDSLVKYDASLTLTPRLAESWEVSPDGRVITFHLRDGVRWHDGAPFSADDVVFTVNKVRDPKTQSRSFLAAFEDLESIEALDARTVRATYRTPYADALDSWMLPIVPAHLVAKEADVLTGEFARRPIGCGPYRMVRAEPGSEIVMEANPDYWDGAPRNGGVTIKIIPNERTAYEALLHGELDVMNLTYDLLAEARASEAAAQRLSEIIFWRLGVWAIGWNQDGSNPFFTDPRVRRAMILALDRELYASTALAGLARPAVSTYLPGSAWADPTLSPLPYDPIEAKRLLAEAGWTDSNGDGVLDRGGTALRFTLMMPVSSQELVNRLAVWLQDSLGKIGAAVTLDKLEWRAFQERRTQHRFQAVLASMTFTPVPDQFELFHSSAREDGMNYGGIHDEELDRLLVEGRRTFDGDARRAIYHAIEQRLHEQQAISGLFHLAVPVVHDRRLTGVAPSPLGVWLTVPGPRLWSWAEGRSG